MDDRQRRERAEVQAVYDSQARLTRKVGRGLLVFAIVWIPALVIVPGVFKQGAIASMLLATTAAVVVMIIIERYWLAPRDRERERRGQLPPPPGQERPDPAGGIEGLIDRLSGRLRR